METTSVREGIVQRSCFQVEATVEEKSTSVVLCRADKQDGCEGARGTSGVLCREGWVWVGSLGRGSFPTNFP